ncbi:MAG: hypothetical protein LBC68_12470 [Prevotellaceae bacterium]|jgi:hypothetical protein|nr:hypothetical protein [Prevotellaceae bacterium]
MLHNLQIQKLLVSANTVRSPYEKVKLIKKAINIADAHNDIEWGFDLRKQIIEAEKNTSSCIEGLPAFAWLLETYEHHPELCKESDFMLEYKWMIQAARRNANVSMQQFESIVEDYKTRLLLNDFSLHSYYTAKAQMAFQQQKFDEAKEYLDLRKTEERDDLSSCIACEIHDLVEYELLTGDISDAITTGADIFSGKEHCRYIPFQTVCITLNILDKYGYDDSANQLFKIADFSLKKMQNIDMSNIGYIGYLIFFLTGRDKSKAWELFEKYLNWSLNCEDYYNFQFSSGALSLFKGSGTYSLNVSSEIPWYKPSGIYELPELYDYYKNQAATLAAKFDDRNGNTNFTDELYSID